MMKEREVFVNEIKSKNNAIVFLSQSNLITKVEHLNMPLKNERTS